MYKWWVPAIAVATVTILALIGIMYIVDWEKPVSYAFIPTTASVFNKPTNPSKNVKVSLYYETMCPFSKEFIQDQICPVLGTLSKYFYVEFVPYGNAQIENTTTEEVSISCQHGSEECEGNRVQSCALHYLSYLQSTKFICCMESENYFQPQGERCLEKLGIDVPTIANCANGQEGENLHYLNGLKTANLKPRHKGVPWIIFNDQFKDEEEIHDATKNFMSVLCKYIPAPKPVICFDNKELLNSLRN